MLKRSHCPAGDALLVASIDAIGTARVPQVLHHAGLRVTVLGRPGLAVGRSRFVHRYLRTVGGPDEILQALKLHLREATTSYRLILQADDPLLWAAARQQEQTWMSSWFPFSLADRRFACSLSKVEFIRESGRRRLPVPQFSLCQTSAEARTAAEKFSYPLMLKLPYGLAGSAGHCVHDDDALMRKAEEVAQGQPFLVQEFIPGAVGASPVLFDHGRPVCWFSYFMLQPWPTPFAAASAIEITDHPDVEALLEGVGALTGFHGLGALDWVHDPRTDRLLLIEFNARPTPALAFGPYAGVNFSSALRDWLAGSCAVHRPQAPTGQKRTHFLFPQSLYYAIDHRAVAPLLALWRDAPWHDPRLLLAHGRRVLTHFLPLRWKTWLKVTAASLSSQNGPTAKGKERIPVADEPSEAAVAPSSDRALP